MRWLYHTDLNDCVNILYEVFLLPCNVIAPLFRSYIYFHFWQFWNQKPPDNDPSQMLRTIDWNPTISSIKMPSAIKHQSNISWLVTHPISTQNIFHFCDCCITHCSLVVSYGIRDHSQPWLRHGSLPVEHQVEQSCKILQFCSGLNVFYLTSLLSTVNPTRYKHYFVLLYCFVFIFHFYCT